MVHEFSTRPATGQVAATADYARCVCWSLWYTPHKTPHHLQLEIERILPAYQFYPEAEWAKYNCRPPDDFPVLGAWRRSEEEAFAFLLDVTGPKARLSKQAYLYIIGMPQEIRRCNTAIRGLKDQLQNLERQGLRRQAARNELRSGYYPRSIRHVVALGTVFTAVANGLWLYASRFSPKSEVGQLLITGIEDIALLTLILFSIICCSYVLVSGALLLKRVIDARGK